MECNALLGALYEPASHKDLSIVSALKLFVCHLNL